MYAGGEGVSKDFILAHMLANLAAVSGDENAVSFRDDVAKKLSSTQLAQAQKLAASWQVGQPLPTSSNNIPTQKTKKQSSKNIKI